MLRLDAFNKDQTKKKKKRDRLSASGFSKQKDVCHLTVLSVASSSFPYRHFALYEIQTPAGRHVQQVLWKGLVSTTTQYYMSLNDFGIVVWLQK